MCFCAFSLSAQDYYVSSLLGNDSNSGTEKAPFATINKGIAEVSAGGTVFVMVSIPATYLDACCEQSGHGKFLQIIIIFEINASLIVINSCSFTLCATL